MSLSDLLKATGAADALKTGGVALIILCTLAQIAPIKLNPWTWIWKMIVAFFFFFDRKIGEGLNGEVITKLGVISGRLDDMGHRLDALEVYNKAQDEKHAEEKALDARRRILRFGDEIRNKVRHSKEHFTNMFRDIKYYRTYCDTHPNFENGEVVNTIEIIEETHKKCVRENDFL